MATTTYTVFVNDVALEGTKSKKATAVDLARAERKAQGADVRVETNAGTVVFEAKAPKKIKMSPRYTRVVELPEDAKLPEGARVAYIRARKNLAILHDAETGEYAVHDFVKGETLASELETTREAGAFCKTVPVPANA
jgi:hypothetical protein